MQSKACARAGANRRRGGQWRRGQLVCRDPPTVPGFSRYSEVLPDVGSEDPAFPAAIQLICISRVHPTSVQVWLYEMVNNQVCEQTWSTESDALHCPAADHAGAGRFLAAIAKAQGPDEG
jgi:hypothetical protein